MLQPVTPPPTITTCARLGSAPAAVSGLIVTIFLPIAAHLAICLARAGTEGPGGLLPGDSRAPAGHRVSHRQPARARCAGMLRPIPPPVTGFPPGAGPAAR